MKTLKIKFVGFWNGFNPETNILYRIIAKHYKIKISDNPDYIICSVFPDSNGDYYSYCKYPQIRIMFSGENYIPDFNYVDYAISSYPLSLFDRHYCFPVCMHNCGNHFSYLWNTERSFDEKIFLDKPYFANFIFSHESEFGFRGDFFRKLSKYKRIESPGTYLKNTYLSHPISFADNSKVDFQKKTKFTICFESCYHEGFVTEKITDAFLANTIPIYYGSSTVKDIFNEEAFLFCSGSNEFKKIIKKVIELDNDDSKYLEMINRPVFNKQFDYDKKLKGLESFLQNIFEQPIKKAVRRSRVYSPSFHESYLNSNNK